MATKSQKKKMFTGVIEECEKLKDSGNGWGRYSVFFEDEEEEFGVAIPMDFNDPETDNYISLEEGMEITVTEGPFKDWIIVTNQFENKSKGSSKRSSRPSRREEEEDDAPKSRTSRGSTRSSSASTSRRSSRKSSGSDSEEKSGYQPSDYQKAINHSIKVQVWGKMLCDLTIAGVEDPYTVLMGIKEDAEDFVEEFCKD